MSSLLPFGERKFPDAGLLSSSMSRGWRGISAELRAHPSCEVPAICPDQMEITLAIATSSGAMVERRGNGQFQQTAACPNTLWLCPIGVEEDSIRITGPLDKVLHLYVPREQFALLDAMSSRPVRPDQIMYLANLDDDLVRQIGYRILRELDDETAGGSLLIEHLSLSLLAHLVSICSGDSLPPDDAHKVGALDRKRLSRVLAYVEEHLDTDLSLAELAEIACLSRHHFARAFKEATGMPPNRYVSTKRLDQARRLLAGSDLSVVEVAYACRFSSQASFSRAFHRQNGMSPREYRRRSAI